MDVSTIGSGTLAVTGAVSGTIQGSFMTPDSGAVQSIEFHPQSDMSRGEMITVSFQPDQDPCRGVLEEPYVFRFVVDTEGYMPSFTDSGQLIQAPRKVLDMVSLDENEDGYLDIFWVGRALEVTPYTYWETLNNDGQGFFSNSSGPIVSDYSRAVATSDLNLDGTPDLMYSAYIDDGHSHAPPLIVKGLISHEEIHLPTTIWDNKGYPVCIISPDDCSSLEPGRYSIIWDSKDPVIDYDGIVSADLDGDKFPEVIFRWLDPYELSPGNHNWYFPLSHVSVHPSELLSFHGQIELSSPGTYSEELIADLFLATSTDQNYSLDIPASDVATGDMDGDGDDDLVILENKVLDRLDSTPAGSVNGFHILLDDSSSLKSYELTNERPPDPHTNVVLEYTPESVALGDVDGDGDLDLLFSGKKYHLLKFNEGDRKFTQGTWILDESPPSINNISRNALGPQNFSYTRVSFVDVDGDGDNDIYNGGGYFFLNNGFGEFNEGPLEGVSGHIKPDPENSMVYLMEDFDNDGDIDIVFASTGLKLQVWFNDLYQQSPVPDATGLKNSANNSQTPSTSGTNASSADAQGPVRGDPPSGSTDSPSTSGTTTGLADMPASGTKPPSTAGTTAGPTDTPNSSAGESSPNLPSGETGSTDDLNTGNVWTKQTLESGSEDAGKMVRMSYGPSPYSLHMVYQKEAEGKDKIFYKTYDTRSSTHSGAERITFSGDSNEEPGDIKSACGNLDVDPDNPVCISYYSDSDLHGAWYIEEMEESDGGFGVRDGLQNKTIDADGTVGRYSTILIDTSGTAHLVYYNDTDNNLMYVVQEGSDSRFWDEWEQPQVIDGSEGNENVGQYATAAIHDDAIHVLYRTSGNIINHMYSPPPSNSGRTWIRTEVIADDPTKSHLALDLDLLGDPHLVYHRQGSNDLEYAWGIQGENGEWVWENELIDSEGKVGTHASLFMQLIPGQDPIHKPHVSYFDRSNYSLKYATKMLNPLSGTWGWVNETVDNPPKIDSVGKYTDLIVIDDGTVYIAYYDEANGDLKLAHN